jgi:hypothetical protein
MSQPSPAQGPTTINIADLDIAQLSDVKKQLEEASCHRSFVLFMD